MRDNYLEHFLGARFHPLHLRMDGRGRLLDWSGDGAYFGMSLTPSSIGTSLEELLPALIGLDLAERQHLPLLELPGGIVTDVFIEPAADGGADIVLLAAGMTRDLLRPSQQKGHETALLYRRLETLSGELRQKNAELQHAINARNQFISGVSHEFRTPITTILGHCDLLATHCNEASSDIRHSFHSIEKNAKYLLALIDNLLEQGEISAERLTIRNAPLNISRFFRFIVDTFQLPATEKGLKLVYHENVGEALELLLDEHHLYLVLVNLISNALKFTDAGSVTVSAGWHDGMLEVEVRDTGIGIPAADLDRIMEPFSRATNVSGRRGSGLGLSIIKEVVAAMKGKMHIDSTEGEGTAIRLTIPAKRHEKASSEKAGKNRNRTGATAAGRKPVILIVEDDTDIASLYRIILEHAGMSPVCFIDGSGFLGNIEEMSPDVIVLDYNLGDEDGVTLAKMARDAGYQGPIILFTATSTINNQLQERADEAGCTRLLQKPRDVTNLAELIRSELGEPDE